MRWVKKVVVATDTSRDRVAASRHYDIQDSTIATLSPTTRSLTQLQWVIEALGPISNTPSHAS